ncbi:TPA: hypothetical protein QDZ12_001315 [Pseudomonas putida]|nr:hypothetical protein [Pseudomonas putida]
MLALIQHSDLALNTFLHMAQRKQAMVTVGLLSLREKLLMTLAMVDACLNEPEVS